MNFSKAERWQRATEVPLMVAAVAFLAAYAVPILDPGSPAWVVELCEWVTWVTWALFVLDYAARLVLAEDRRRYVLHHWVDILVIALPLLRPLRLLRLVALLAVLNRRAGLRLRGRLAVYVAGGASLLAFCSALAVLDVERDSPEANITSFGDAMWWAMTTMTSVGYGDAYPVTPTGRLVAVVLMLGGIALLGVVTATLASWLVQAVETEEGENERLRREVAGLNDRIETLLGERRPSSSAP